MSERIFPSSNKEEHHRIIVKHHQTSHSTTSLPFTRHSHTQKIKKRKRIQNQNTFLRTIRPEACDTQISTTILNSSIMRTSLAISFARRAAVVASKRAAPHYATFCRAMSSESKFATNMDIVEEINAPVNEKVPYGVDAPDGETDAYTLDEFQDAMKTIDETAAIENSESFKKTQAELKRTFAIDAPDGETDGHILEEMQEIDHIIDEAADLEDKAKIDSQHAADDAVFKDRAKDAQHDW